MKTQLTALALGIAVSTGVLADSGEDQKTAAHGIGFVTGALAGGAVGGPPGAMIGALLGFFVSDGAHHDKLEKLSDEKLEQQRQALVAMQERLIIAEQEAEVQLVSLEQFVSTVSDSETSIQFRTGSDVIEDHYIPQLNLLSNQLRGDAALRVQLSGYADPRGDAGYNQSLSEQRIEQVSRYLLDQGVAEEQILSQAYGETQLLSEAASGEDHFFERRVVIRLAPVSSMTTASN